MIHREIKFESFWHKKLVTCGTKIRPGKVGNWRIFELNWLNIKSQIDSTLRVKMTQHLFDSNWLNIKSQIDSTLRVKLTQHLESNWLNIESQIGSTLRVKWTQYWESNWLNIESQIDSTLRVKLTQHWESNWLKYSPVTHFARSNYNSASDSTFKVKITQFFFSVHWEKPLGQFDFKNWVKFQFRQWLNFFGPNDSIFLIVHWEKMESFWLEKLGQILVPPVTQLLGSEWLNFFPRCTERKNWVILT